MQKHQSVSPAGVRGSSVAPGSSTDDSNLLHGPVIILAPPGTLLGAKLAPEELLGVSWPQHASLTLKKRSPDLSWDTLGGEVRGQKATRGPLESVSGGSF